MLIKLKPEARRTITLLCVVLDFSVGGISLPSREYYKSKDFEDKIEMFRNHLENTRLILEKNNIKLDDNFVENVISFENKIADYSMKPDQSREYEKYYTNTTLDNLYKDLNSLNSLPRKQEAPRQNWRNP